MQFGRWEDSDRVGGLTRKPPAVVVVSRLHCWISEQPLCCVRSRSHQYHGRSRCNSKGTAVQSSGQIGANSVHQWWMWRPLYHCHSTIEESDIPLSDWVLSSIRRYWLLFVIHQHQMKYLLTQLSLILHLSPLSYSLFPFSNPSPTSQYKQHNGWNTCPQQALRNPPQELRKGIPSMPCHRP